MCSDRPRASEYCFAISAPRYNTVWNWKGANIEIGIFILVPKNERPVVSNKWTFRQPPQQTRLYLALQVFVSARGGGGRFEQIGMGKEGAEICEEGTSCTLRRSFGCSQSVATPDSPPREKGNICMS
jgi:hypothetical protein